ncbi:hypothetical protein HQQ94_00725 [Shewanella sp. VB17]|uniref:hypothetical protein n=1 Tax=Shewanella sp. VB17 TaxID=2739432 RepID=UPI00156541AB|nr:hypothetical protein [Shewanella sp. VB17]NRD71800.1 hypothetical protein [Shewanella sp. VB17]
MTFGRGVDIGSRSAAEVGAIFNRVAQDANPISADRLPWLTCRRPARVIGE